MNADENSVASVLKDYQTALNRSDTGAVLKLYAPDGVFMPQHSPSSVGIAAVRKAYEAGLRPSLLLWSSKSPRYGRSRRIGCWRVQTPPALPKTTRPARRVRRPTRNSSY